MPGEKVVIHCHDNVVSANIPAKEYQRLINSLPDDYSKTGQLFESLTVVVGIIVVHTTNVYVEECLTNGATGVVKHVDLRMEETNRPSIILVCFMSLELVGQHERNTENFTTQAFIQIGHMYLIHKEHL